MRVEKIVVLGTGGTIAGTAASVQDHLGYAAAQRGIDDLVAGIAGLHAQELELEQVAQIDSKDIDERIWSLLIDRCAHWLSKPQVRGVVVTHGTDTLEETAFLLQRVLAPDKPVVLTCAMRPATALMADGPQNLLDAVTAARTAGVRGVLVVCAGKVHEALHVRKRHTYALDAFDSGERGPVAVVEDGALRPLSGWSDGGQGADDALRKRLARVQPWPWVEIVTSHAGARAGAVDALVAQGVRGLVVAGTGNGTVHHALLDALLRAQDAGVRVVRATRCAQGRVLPHQGDVLPHAAVPSPVKARIDLQLALLAQGEA
ncbi:asparaginase [Ramlibacter sp. AN1015]|uniref:asparaginase n=1 Tax=Ramlibacter sp. AN1015 TaxID=3133428 RepID=UPI0030BBAA20